METIAILIFLICFVVVVLGIVGLIKPLTRLKMSSRLAALGWILGGFVGMVVAAVNAPPTQQKAGSNDTNDQAKVAEKAPEPAPQQIITPPSAPATPEHFYSSVDGDDYLYSAGISENARDAGQVAGQFIAFRYRGVKDGKITLTSEGMTLRCDEDCAVITMIDQFGNKQHFEYNPDSVAGAAFTDAMNNLLVEHPSRKENDGAK